MAVDVLADMFTSSLLDPDEFESERGVILEELAMADDDPADVASERFFEAVFGAHPLGRPIGGTPESIRAATRDAVWEHYRRTTGRTTRRHGRGGRRPRRRRAPARGALGRGGLGARRAGGAGRPARHGRLGIEPSTPVTVVDRPIEQVNLVLGVPGVVATDDRRVTLSVLNTVLGGGMSSRLFQEVRERRGLAYSVYSFAPGYSDAGLFGVYAGCLPAKVDQVLGTHCGRPRRGGPQRTHASRSCERGKGQTKGLHRARSLGLGLPE